MYNMHLNRNIAANVKHDVYRGLRSKKGSVHTQPPEAEEQLVVAQWWLLILDRVSHHRLGSPQQSLH